jgi:hypothetical protein
VRKNGDSSGTLNGKATAGSIYVMNAVIREHQRTVWFVHGRAYRVVMITIVLEL